MQGDGGSGGCAPMPPSRGGSRLPPLLSQRRTIWVAAMCTRKESGIATPGFLQVLMQTPDKEPRRRTAPPPDGGHARVSAGASLANGSPTSNTGPGSWPARVMSIACGSIISARGRRHAQRLRCSGANDRRIPNCSTGWPATWSNNGGSRTDPPTHHEQQRLPASRPTRMTGRKIDPNAISSATRASPLEAETIRDAMLAVSGQLDYGPGTLTPTWTAAACTSSSSGAS